VILPDVNVLLYAFKEGAPGHERFRSWLEAAAAGPDPIGVCELVLSGVVRVSTHPRVFDRPATPAEALDFAEWMRSLPVAVPLAPGARHWEIFARLVQRAECRGGLVSDAYLAALAIEHGCEWVTTDRDFARFHGLRWRHPLEGAGQ